MRTIFNRNPGTLSINRLAYGTPVKTGRYTPQLERIETVEEEAPEDQAADSKETEEP